MGARGRTPALPDAGDANAPYNALTNTPLAGLHQQGPLAPLSGKVQRRGVGPEGDLAMRNQHESGIVEPDETFS